MAQPGTPPSGPFVPESPEPPAEPPTVDRSAAFAAGPAPIPRKVAVIGLAVLLALGLGGTLLDRIFANAGSANRAAPASANKKAKTARPSALRVVKVPLTSLPGGAPLAHFLGTEALAENLAPHFALVGQRTPRVTLASLRGKVVVLSFLDSPCDDNCSVVGPELATADRLLGARASRVAFVTVNTDPLHTAFTPAPPAFVGTGLETLPNTHFLTGTVHTLNPVWVDYGITIDVASSGRIAHSDLVYFIDPRGRLRYRITPPANESRSGQYSLPAAQQARVAKGIAAYAAALLPASGAKG